MHALTVILILISSSIVVQVAVANDNAIAIIQTAEKSLSGLSSQVSAEVIIRRPNYSRVIKLRWWSMNDRMTLHTTEQLPAGERTIVWLRAQQKYWSYLEQGTDTLPIQIDPHQPWIGTDFDLEEMLGDTAWLTRYQFRILRQEQKHTLVECRPKSELDKSIRILYWTRRRDGLPMQKRFLNENEEPVKTIDYSRFRRFDDRLIPTRITVTLVDKRQKSILTVEKSLFDRTLPLQLFDPRVLPSLSQTHPKSNEFWFYPRIHPRQPTLAVQVSTKAGSVPPSQPSPVSAVKTHEKQPN